MLFVPTIARASRIHSTSRFVFSVLTIALCVWILAAIPAPAVDIVTIEEDWEVTIQDPDPNSAGPQIACVLAPFGHLDGLHAVFELNHRTQPDFTSGGMQLQLWNGETLEAYGNYPNPSILSLPTETIRWTQRMHMDGGQLTLEIIHGSSNSWGAFGGQGYLRHALQMDVSNFNSYNPEVVVAQSGISYAANRVEQLVLKEIRYVASTGEVYTDNTVRVVHGD